MRDFIMKFENLERLELIGLRLVDHLEDMMQAIKRPKLKHLNLMLNGIEQEYCTYFNYMLNFETIESLNISSNWFGCAGLKRFKEQFKLFKNLRFLSLSNNKLCKSVDAIFNHQDHMEIKEVLLACGSGLEELEMCENSMEDKSMTKYLAEVIGGKMPHLKRLNLAKNPISGEGLVCLLE